MGYLKRPRGRYVLLGLGLILGGGLFALSVWFFVGYMPLVALGASSVMLGTVSLALGRSLPGISSEASTILMEAHRLNMEALVEEFGLRTTAIYLPSSLTNGQARALIPFSDGTVNLSSSNSIDQRLIAKFGPGPDDYGLLVATAGSAAVSFGSSAAEGSVGEFESALADLIIGVMDLSDSVRVRQIDGKQISVEVSRPALDERNDVASEVLGSPLGSIAATLAAETFGIAVSVASEEKSGRWHVIELQLLPEVVA